MSYYANRRYNPPADVYRASTLVGQHTGPRAGEDHNVLSPAGFEAWQKQWRADRAASPAGDAVREHLSVKG